MRGVQKSKRVSWATDGNLCQVRLFLSEDSPSLAGIDSQDHLQAKNKPRALHGTSSGPDDVLPPGFEGVNSKNQFKNKLVQIPLIKWRCPPKFALDASWRVVAGEGSKEVETQNQRELSVLEAFYPRSSTIPPDPDISLDIKNSFYDDRATPLVPIIPIEEEEAVGEISNGTSLLPAGTPPASVTPGFLQASYATSTSAANVVENEGSTAMTSEPYLLAAATAALSAVASNNQRGKLIDHELLIKILSNPTMLENLSKNRGNNSSNTSMSSSTPAAPSSTVPTIHQDPPPHHPARFDQVDSSTVSSTSKEKFYLSGSSNVNLPQPVQYSHAPAQSTTEAGMPSFKSITMNFNPSPPVQFSHVHTPPTTGVGRPPLESVSARPPEQDISYFKSLIHQHGNGSAEAGSVAGHPPSARHPCNGSSQHIINLNELARNKTMKQKFPKPCAYFNTPKGCRHGANCQFQHDGPMFQQQRVGSYVERQGAKRMKMDNRETRDPPQPFM